MQCVTILSIANNCILTFISSQSDPKLKTNKQKQIKQTKKSNTINFAERNEDAAL